VQLTGKPILDENGNTLYDPGLLKGVKGIGWYIEEYGVTQLSFNITDITATPVHQVFETSCQRAENRGVRVTGSEIVGVVPLQVMIDAGMYFLHKQKRSAGISDQEIIKIAIKSLGLNDLSIFDPEKKIIEYLTMDKTEKSLYKLTLKEFVEETASESPAPGGGSVSASMGAMGASLGTMVANLSSHKKGWDERWAEFARWAEKGKKYQDELLQLIDEDTRAFNGILLAYKMPKENQEQESERKNAIQNAIRHAMEVPMRVMHLSFQSMDVMKEMAQNGNPNSVSDAGVGALAARSAVLGAVMNVRINAGNCADKEFVSKALKEADEIEKRTIKLETEILKIVEQKIIKV
jgi:glutamate formiminotransferase/formiminotetrahydrofolate cyclodeaminase